MSLHNTSKATLLSATAISAAGQTGAEIDVSNYLEATLYVKVTAKTGTSPTVDLDLETSHDGTDWHTHTSLTQLNDPTLTFYQAVTKLTQLGEKVRINSTAVGGTSSPSMTITATIILKT